MLSGWSLQSLVHAQKATHTTMAPTTRKPTTTAKGLGHRHQLAAAGLRRSHIDGSPCDWCGRPRYLDRTKNWDYNPESTSPNNGKLHADHSKMSRKEALRLGLPVPLPDRLLHGACNIQRGEGGNDHLAAAATGAGPDLGQLVMEWPW